MARQKKQKKDRFENPVARVIKVILKVAVSLVAVAAIVAALTVLPSYSRMVNALMGYEQGWNTSESAAEGLDLEYYKAGYTADELADAQVALDEEIAAEGLILLQNNDDALPLAKGTTLSFFSGNSAVFGGSQSLTDMFTGGAGKSYDNLNEALAAEGIGVNETLEDFYLNGAGANYTMGSGSLSFGAGEDFSINECPLSELEAADGVLESCEGTTPVFVLRRVAGEGRDMPRGMYNHASNPEDQAKTYLEPDSTELEILSYLNDNFDNVILVVASANPVELDWVADYPNIKSILYVPSTGTSGMASLAKILSGAVSPSGHTVDTFEADTLASPAAQNYGDYEYLDDDGNPTGYNYVSYEEGIYVGYRYFETRYEDVVLNQGNAGDWNYDEEVVYPFGYGLSYTDFAWSDFQLTEDGENITATVTVTNTGDVAGRDAVEIYAQSPYTDYDKENGVEKSSVVLVNYAKTKLLEPGESQTVEVTFTREQLASYDTYGAGTYILDAGTYYVTAGMDSHAAINNILAAKGADVEGDDALVGSFEVAELDTTTYATDSVSGEAIGNLFEDAEGDLTYLTRADWEGTFPTHDGEPIEGEVSTWGNEINSDDGVSYVYGKVASDELIASIESFDSGNPDVDDSTADMTYGADNGLTLIDLRGLDYDDPQWESLLDELTLDDYNLIINQGGYGTPAAKSVGKPYGYDADTANYLIYGSSKYAFCNVIVLAQTWNQDLAYEFGSLIGADGNLNGATGWYAPSMNIHRAAYTGRAREYYSEDPFVSGMVASLSVKGAAEKGMYATIKHFFLNEQENHRGDADAQDSLGAVCTWANEQSIREIYLMPFEMCMKLDDIETTYVEETDDGTYVEKTYTHPASQGVMSSFNRIGTTWAGGNYTVITELLRNEWGFDGWVITDSAGGGQPHMNAKQMLEAGGDIKLSTQPSDAQDITIEEGMGATDWQAARDAMHRLMYAIANSHAMNGAMPGSTYDAGFQLSQKLQVGLVGGGALILGLVAFSEVRHHSKKKAWKAEHAAKQAA